MDNLEYQLEATAMKEEEHNKSYEEYKNHMESYTPWKWVNHHPAICVCDRWKNNIEYLMRLFDHTTKYNGETISHCPWCGELLIDRSYRKAKKRNHRIHIYDMYRGVKDGDLVSVKDICKDPWYVTHKCAYHYYPLLIAIDYNQYDIAKFLLEQGANVNTKDEYQRTALMCAIRSYSLDCVKLLIDHGADLTLKDGNGYNILHWAGSSDRENIAIYLIEELGKRGFTIDNIRGRLEIKL